MNHQGRDSARLVPARAARAGEALTTSLGPSSWQRTAVVLFVGYVAVAAFVTAVGLVLTNLLADGAVGTWDETSTAWLADHRGHALDGITDALSRSGDTVGAILIAVIVCVFLWVRHWRWEIVLVVSALALELSVFLFANHVVGRPRPEVERMGSTPSTSSFPSGHSAASLVLWLSIAIFVVAATRRWLPRAIAIAAAVVMPLSVGFARVYRGMHHPLDVAAGLLMGGLVLLVSIVAVSAGRGPETEAEAEADDVAAEPAQGRSFVPSPTNEPQEVVA